MEVNTSGLIKVKCLIANLFTSIANGTSIDLYCDLLHSRYQRLFHRLEVKNK